MRTSPDADRSRHTTRALFGAVLLGSAALAALPAAALDRSIAGTNGMISGGHPLAVQAGLKVLQSGGNACDAAVAVSTALSVLMTDMMGPAGSGFAVLWIADKKELVTLDFNGAAPSATDPKLFDMEKKRRGILAPTVPGALKGWEALHQRCGTKPWSELWTDAVAYAEKRVLDQDSAFHIRRHIPEIGINESWAKEFLGSDGKALPQGAIHSRKDLAQSYRLFASLGSDALYNGVVGDRLAEFMKANGGLITKKDLADYKVIWGKPIESAYRGYKVYGHPPPSSALTWMQMLSFIEGYDLKAMKHNSPEYLRTFVEAAKYAHMDAYRWVSDPAFVKAPIEKLLSKEYAKEIKEKIDRGIYQVKPTKTTWYDKPQINTATSHMSVVDRWGNAVSMTNTLGTFFGAGVVADGTGLVLSNGMDWFDIDENIWTGEKPGNLVMAPGKRNRWTLAPGMIFKDDKLVMVVGGAGAESTMWGIAQPIVNILDFDMDPQSAISAPRFQYGDIYHYTGGTEVQLQPGIPDDVRAKLKADGYNIPDPGKQRNPAIGTTNIVTIDQASGAYFGGAARLGRDFVAGY